MATSENLVACIGCNAPVPAVPDTDGANHSYLGTAPGCWAIFGEVLAREYSDEQYSSVHNLTVDTYALQHPGTQSRQTIQSAAVHLISLHSQIEQGYDTLQAAKVKQAAMRHRAKYVWLAPPELAGALTILDVHRAADAASHIEIVSQWATTVWNAWQVHHPTIREWAAL